MFPIKTIDHLSYSQINLYQTCPLAWWLTYVLGIEPKASIYMIVGSAVHSALNDYFTDQLLGIKPMSIDELIVHSKETIEAALAETKYEMPKKGQSLEDIVDSRLQGLREYMENIGSNLTVKFTEKKLQRVIPGTSINFIGILDLISAEKTVIDFKIVGATWSQSKALTSLQPVAYGFLLGREIQFEIHCISTKGSKVLPVPVTQQNIDTYSEMIKVLSFAMTEVAAGRQAPERCRTSSDCYMCSCKAACDLHRYGLIDDLMEMVQVDRKAMVNAGR